MERSNEERQTDLNPHRAEERARATALQAARLRERQVPLTGDETSEEIADMATAIERFEAAVMAVGGDSMTNAPDSRDPDDEALVLPRRREGEDPRAYAARVNQYAERLRRQD